MRTITLDLADAPALTAADLARGPVCYVSADPMPDDIRRYLATRPATVRVYFNTERRYTVRSADGQRLTLGDLGRAPVRVAHLRRVMTNR